MVAQPACRLDPGLGGLGIGPHGPGLGLGGPANGLRAHLILEKDSPHPWFCDMYLHLDTILIRIIVISIFWNFHKSTNHISNCSSNHRRLIDHREVTNADQYWHVVDRLLRCKIDGSKLWRMSACRSMDQGHHESALL